jgi:hypothetical protein
MTVMVRAAARGKTGGAAAHIDPHTVEAIRLFATIVLVIVGLAGLGALAATLGPLDMPTGGPTPAGW